MTVDARSSCQVTVLTPAGRGAIATISVSGPRAASLVRPSFAPARPASWDRVPVGRVLFGHWSAGDSAGEEVVVCCKSADAWEIHCHGGQAATEAIVQSLVAAGAQPAPAAAWYLRQTPDPIAAQAREALAAARTERAAAVLLDQYRGALRRELEAALGEIERGSAAVAAAGLARLDRLSGAGLHLTRCWRVVVAGPPNTGKSSLVNAILGYPRSIVFDEPGTTRDVLTALTAIDGWPVELVDTAGLRASQDAIESEGVARARAQMKAADLVLLVCDATAGRTAELRELAAEWPAALVVANKCDLLADRSPSQAWGLATSALTGQATEDLVRQIILRLVPAPPQPGEAVPFSRRQVDAVRQARAALDRGDHSTAAKCLTRLLQTET